MKIFVIANVLCIWMAAATQAGSFERRAISSAQRVSASDLDEALPTRPFARWFNKTIGPDAGVVWQLTQCGAPITAPGETGQDLPACAEINARLPDGRNVFVAISVGTFKKGLTGKPSFFLAVIEQNERLYPVRRLRDLPEMLRAPDGPSASAAKNRVADLPAIKMDTVGGPRRSNLNPLVTFRLTARKGPACARAPAPCPHIDWLQLAPRPR
jgi:hypothetical protein